MNLHPIAFLGLGAFLCISFIFCLFRAVKFFTTRAPRPPFVLPEIVREELRAGSTIWTDSATMESMSHTLDSLSLNLQRELSQAMANDQAAGQTLASMRAQASRYDQLGIQQRPPVQPSQIDQALAARAAEYAQALRVMGINPETFEREPSRTRAYQDRLQIYEKILGKCLVGRQQIAALKAAFATKGREV